MLADFAYSRGDSALAFGVTEALRGQLQDIPNLVLPSRNGADDWCRRIMGLDGCPAAPDSAYQLFRRAGFHGVLVGSIQRLGGGFSLAVSLRAMGGEASQIRAAETASDSTDLLNAVQRLGENLRDQLVPNLPLLEAADPDDRTLFTVRSMDAYRALREAERSWGVDYITALQGFRRAVRLDSTFAWALRRLSVGLWNLGIRRDEQIRAATAAFAMADSVTPYERGLIVGSYYNAIEDHQAAIEAYRQVLDENPGARTPLNNTARVYEILRQVDLARQLSWRLGDTTMQRFGFYERGLMRDLINVGDLETVDSLLELARLAQADTGSQFQLTMRDRLISERRYAELQSLDATTSLGREETRTDRFFRLRQDQQMSLVLGRIADFESQASEFSRMNEELDNPWGVLNQAAAVARVRVGFRGDSAGARRAVADALARYPLDGVDVLDRPYAQLATALASVGDVTAAEGLIARWQREVPERYQNLDGDLIDLARGDIALASGRPQEAIEHYRRGDLYGCIPCNQPRFARAWDALGQPDSAIAAYERFVTIPSTGRYTTDGFELARAYLRLGELYEETGDRDNAIERYGDFVEAWQQADPALLAQVEDVRSRIARLTGETGVR